MYHLRDAYDSESSPTVATGVLAVGISVMFTVGLFLIINAHNNNQSQELAQTVAAIRKSQTEGIDLSTALAQIKAANAAGKSTPVSTGPVNGNFDTITVKGTSALQGNVQVDKNIAIGSKNTKGELKVTGTIIKNGTNIDNLYIQNVSGDPQNETSIAVSDIMASTLTVDAANIGDASISGDLTLGGSLNLGSDLSVASLVDADSLTISNDATIGGALSVTNDSTFDGNLDAGSISIGGTDLNTAFIQASPASPQTADISIVGDINTSTLTTTGLATADSLLVTNTANVGDLTATGSVTASSLVVPAGVDLFTLQSAVDTQGTPSTGDDTNYLSVAGETVFGDSVTIGTTHYHDFGGGPVQVFDSGGNLQVYGTLTVGGGVDGTDVASGGDLAVTGTISLGGSDITTLFQPAGNYIVDGDPISAPSLDSTGDTTVGGVLNINDALGSVSVGTTIGRTITTNSTSGADGETCVDGTSHIRINAIASGIVTAASCVGNNDSINGFPYYDLAENFPSNDSLTAGDVVSIDSANPEYVRKNTSANDRLAIGVVSTAPGVTLGQNGPGYPVALSGRVPVKVNDEGGVVTVGDYLTSSSMPGYAKKAAAGDKTIGQAMANLSGASGTVVMFVNTSGGNVPAQAFIQSAQSLSGTATITNLEVTGSVSVVNLQVKGHIIGNDDTRGVVTIPAGSKTVHHDFSSVYSKTPVVVASPGNQAALYNVLSTASGFDISLPTATTTDTTFNYLVQE